MESCFGSDHPEVAQSYNALAWICTRTLQLHFFLLVWYFFMNVWCVVS